MNQKRIDLISRFDLSTNVNQNIFHIKMKYIIQNCKNRTK